MKLEFSHSTLEKILIEFQENPSRGNRVVSCGRTAGQTDMTKLTAAGRNFTKALQIDSNTHNSGKKQNDMFK